MKKVVIITLLCLGTMAASAQKVRLMSYNVRNCLGIDKVKSIERCAEVIRASKADVIAVQELDSMTRRNKCYMIGELAERTGYHPYFHRTIPYRGGSYGIGMLSKEPALSVEFYRLPCRKEPRGLLVVEFEKFYYLCTHLSLSKPHRLESVEIIRDVVSKLDKPAFLAGDFNAKPHSETITELRTFMTLLSNDKQFTFPSDEPRSCIDYIMGYNCPFKAKRRRVIDTPASDHCPICVDIKMGKTKKK